MTWNEGWYSDPQNPNGPPRWWDGQRWGPQQQQATRKPLLWRFVWALFFAGAAIIIFLPIKETLLGTDQTCGNAFSALSIQPLDTVVGTDLEAAAQNVADQCHSDGTTRLWIGGLLAAAGIGSSIAVRKWEMNRA